MKICKPVFLVVVLAFFSIMAGTALAQNLQNGAVRGTVFDTSHASVATAKLTLTNPSTGIRRDLQVESDGSYDFDNVRPGEYTITAVADGFAVTTVKQIVVITEPRHHHAVENPIANCGGNRQQRGSRRHHHRRNNPVT
jgi:hypothetical protein